MKQSIARHIIASHTCFSRRNTPFLLEKHSVSLGETLRSSVYSSCKQTLLTLLLIFSGVVGSWGQTDYSGTYFIASCGQSENRGSDYTYSPTEHDNNFYLCPTEDWLYYNGDNYPNYTNAPNGQPFLTTFKCKNATLHSTYDSKEAMWTLIKHPTLDYYYIRRNKDGKYLVRNEQMKKAANTADGNANRLRVHIETTSSPGDDALFAVTIPTGKTTYVISPKTDDGWYLNVHQGNFDALSGQKASQKNDGPTGYTNVGGTIGIYTAINDDNAPFMLEDIIQSPLITQQNNNTIAITYPGTEPVTLYYTTDGSKPDPTKVGESDPTKIYTPGTTTISMINPVTTVKAIAVKTKDTDETLDTYSRVVSLTTQWYIGSSNYYLFQNVECTDYYMIPGDVSSNNTTVNTSSLFRPSMSWYFLNAGSEDGVLYYYIINGHTGDYLYRTGNSVYMKASSAFDNTDNGYKFSIRQGYDTNNDPVAGFNIIPKGAADNTYCIFKGGYNNPTLANAKEDVVKYDKNARNKNYGQWNIISAPDNKLPASLTYDSSNPADANWPTFLSSSSKTKYFKIENVGAEGFYMNPPENLSTGFVAATGTSTGGNELAWCVVEAGHDDWQKYYYIIHASTGKYMYFTKTIPDNPMEMTGQSNVIALRDYDNTNTNLYQFVFAKSTVDGAYYIVPKGLTGATYNKYYALYRDANNPLKSTSNRLSDSYKWKFVSATLFCNAPEFVEEEGKIRIKCNTNSAKIYINTESNADPTIAEENLYAPTTKENQNWATTSQVRIKAIASVSDGTNSASSAVATLLNKPDITLSQDTYTYDGTAKQPAVNEVSIGETPNKTTATAETDFETVIATDYSNNINAGTAKVTLRDKASNVYVWHAEKEFTINKKDLTATADNKTISYGDDVPTYTISYTGFENSEDASAVTTPPTITCAYTSTSDVNTYTISVNTDGVATNYNIIPGTPGTLTVNQREVVLSWGTTPFIYNGTAQAPTATATNLKNEDVIGVTVDGAQTNAGDYTATASALTGDKKDNYKLPTANTQDFAIGKRPVTVSGITASDKEYDGTTAATLVLTGATFADGDIIGTDNVTIESATGAFAEANAGAGKTVTISAITLGGSSVANYEFAGSGQQTEITANITKAPLTVTADNKSITYGDAAPIYTITYAGWKNGEDKTILSTEPTASSEYTQGGNAGSYPITVTGGVATNYDITPQNGTLTVGPKTLTQDNISFGEGGIVVVKDGETILTEGTDYTIGEEQHSGINNKYTVTPVIGKNDGTSSGTGNYTGTVSIRHANVHLTTGANQANYSATFVAESAGDADIGHVLPEGFTAYIISSIEGSWAIPEPMEYIPAGVPVLLVAHEEKTGFLVRDAKSADVSDISAQKSYNKLKEVTAELAHFNTRQIYVLYKNEFVLNKEGDLAKGKVYMENPKYVAPSSPSSPAPANLSIAWGNVTGIEDGRWMMDDGRSERWYTLDGRCLIGKPTAKGLYIVNGKKVVIK